MNQKLESLEKDLAYAINLRESAKWRGYYDTANYWEHEVKRLTILVNYERTR